MAIALDASAPAVVTQQANTTATIASAPFTPPANSLVVAMVGIIYNGSTGTGSPFTMSDSLSGTWTTSAQVIWGSGGNPAGGVYTRFVASSAAMTVTLTTDTATKGKQLAVRVLTGTATSSWTGATVAVQSASAAGFLQQNITTTVAGSWVFATGVHDVNPASPTFAANANTTQLAQFVDTGDGGEIPCGYMTTPTVTPGTVLVGWTGGGTGVPEIYTSAEILPPSAAGVTRVPTHYSKVARQRAALW